VPLIEIVTEPDLRSPEEARLFLEKLRQILLYTGVSDVKMEEGSLRCDANISLRPVGADTFGTKTELKNLNSFRFVQKGLEYEEKRQREILMSGGVVEQETRRWDEQKEITVPMRGKEEAHDYRYFPEPDLVRLVIDREWVERVKAELPELPDARRERYMRDYGLSAYDAGVLTASKDLSDYYEEVVKHCQDPKTAANWVMVELMGYVNAQGIEVRDVKLSPANLGKLITLINKGTISGKIAKQVFKELLETDRDPEAIVKEKGLVQITDPEVLRPIVLQVLDANAQSVVDYKNGKDRALGFLVGQVMKATKGKANPELVNKLLLEEIAKR